MLIDVILKFLGAVKSINRDLVGKVKAGAFNELIMIIYLYSTVCFPLYLID